MTRSREYRTLDFDFEIEKTHRNLRRNKHEQQQIEV